jgi:hypothetical protein
LGPDAHTFNLTAGSTKYAWPSYQLEHIVPFERGPRNGVGQELAILEAPLVFVSHARGFVFEKIGLAGWFAIHRGEREKEVWSEHHSTSVPVNEIVIRVSNPEQEA